MEWVAIFFSSRPHFLKLFTMTHPFWVAPHGMAHSFIELCKPLCHDKAVIHEGDTHICICLHIYVLFTLFSFVGYYKILSIVPFAISVQFNSVTQQCLTLCAHMNRSMPGLPVHHQLPKLPKLMSIESVMPSSHLTFCHPHLLLLPIPPSIRVFPNESTLLMKWPKYWSFSFSISPSNEHPGLISFRMTGWISLQSKGLSKVFSNTTVQKHQFFGAQLSLQSNSHIHT